ncbi:unnamed protein product [Leuciscus chuanchicus]
MWSCGHGKAGAGAEMNLTLDSQKTIFRSIGDALSDSVRKKVIFLLYFSSQETPSAPSIFLPCCESPVNRFLSVFVGNMLPLTPWLDPHSLRLTSCGSYSSNTLPLSLSTSGLSSSTKQGRDGWGRWRKGGRKKRKRGEPNRM